MKIEIGGIEALSKDYHNFEEFVDELVDHENSRGRRVPDYDIGILLSAIVFYLFKKAIDKLIDVGIDETIEGRRRRRDEIAADVRDGLEEQRHAELTSSIEELKRAEQQAVELRLPNSTLTEEAASLSALLQWARDNDVKITVTLETEAEGDLREAFEAATKDVAGSSVNDSKRQIE